MRSIRKKKDYPPLPHTQKPNVVTINGQNAAMQIYSGHQTKPLCQALAATKPLCQALAATKPLC